MSSPARGHWGSKSWTRYRIHATVVGTALRRWPDFGGRAGAQEQTPGYARSSAICMERGAGHVSSANRRADRFPSRSYPRWRTHSAAVSGSITGTLFQMVRDLVDDIVLVDEAGNRRRNPARLLEGTPGRRGLRRGGYRRPSGAARSLNPVAPLVMSDERSQYRYAGPSSHRVRRGCGRYGKLASHANGQDTR